MHQEKYSLTWHTYSDHLKGMMKELMMNEDFSDVTIVTEDKKQIKANINILSTCSPVFNEILKKEKNSSLLLYLRGIQFSEMESIMQFIYLGEATFYEERMDEFLAVAKLLEIKELCNAETQTNVPPNDEPSVSDPVTSTENLEARTVTSDHVNEQAPQEERQNVNANRYHCEQCDKTYSSISNLNIHKRAVHEGFKYACDQCNYHATRPDTLNVHIQLKHVGVKYACGHCDYQATTQSNLTVHIQAKHEGIKYACNQCDYQATFQSSLYKHIQTRHEDVKYACGQCDFQANYKVNLTVHIRKMH